MADDATRWRDWSEHDERWIKGSEILFQPESEWPVLSELGEDKNESEVLTALLVTIKPNLMQKVLPENARFS